MNLYNSNNQFSHWLRKNDYYLFILNSQNSKAISVTAKKLQYLHPTPKGICVFGTHSSPLGREKIPEEIWICWSKKENDKTRFCSQSQIATSCPHTLYKPTRESAPCQKEQNNIAPFFHKNIKFFFKLCTNKSACLVTQLPHTRLFPLRLLYIALKRFLVQVHLQVPPIKYSITSPTSIRLILYPGGRFP